MKLFLQHAFLFLLFYLVINCNLVIAEETNQQINLNIIDRLARIEEGQKAIIIEMQTRFEAVLREMNKRFEAVDRRFEAVDQRFESMLREMNQRFEAVDRRFEAFDQRFESMLREMKQRFEAVDQRFESVDKQLAHLNNYIIVMISSFLAIFLTIIGYAIWDRKNGFEKFHEELNQFIQLHKPKEHFSPINDQGKLNQVIDIMKQMSEKFPEMRSIMHAAQLL
ncbi:conserved hypothetical protein, membrane [Candidatus Magnetomorum sp. HK-1]|nr:conserved hypothetical protein, membrane [Candidatus Magnetomorum sp. HK-1]